jgi:hypothetical protein
MEKKEKMLWREDLHTDLNHESVERKRIVPQQDSADVSDNLSQAADEHGDGEAPSLPPEAEIRMNDADEAKEGGEDNVGRE